LSHMKLLVENCSLKGWIRTVYPDHQRHFGDAMYFMQCSILAPKNTVIDEVNNAIIELYLKNCTRTWAHIFWLRQKKVQVLLQEF
jgi:hypothetical protein